MNEDDLGMDSEKFKELVKDRITYIESSKKNKIWFYEDLSEGYPEVSHFIYEILQNADDEGAKSILFKLYENKLEITHNGRDFSFDDVEAITSLQNSYKKYRADKTGEHGRGFKSVFAVTKSPEIYSGKFRIKIEEIFVPVPLDNHMEIDNTKICLPFNHDKRSKSDVYFLIETEFEKLEYLSLLFLRNINQINFETPVTKFSYKREISYLDDKTKKVRIFCLSDKFLRNESFLIFHKFVSIDNIEKKVEVAYKLDEENKIIKLESSKLMVFFPTSIETNLKFLIQAPYNTSKSRDNIKNDSVNNRLIKENAILVSESIKILKKMKLIDINFLSLLPILTPDKSKSEIYKEVYKSVKELFSSDEELLPTTTGNLTSVKNCILAGGKDLISLLQKEQLKELYGVEYWLNTDISDYKKKELKEYLRELGVKEIDFDDNFANKLTSVFLIKQLDAWIIKFYSILKKSHHALWDDENSVLRNKPIIRLENDTHSLPFNLNKEPLVYLPIANSSKFPTVKYIICQNEEAKSFLEKLGIKPPDIRAKIKHSIFPKYHEQREFNNADYFSDFSEIYNYYVENEKESKILFEEIKKLYLILAYDNQSQKKVLMKAENCYLPTNILVQYFKNFQTYFVDIEQYKQFDHINVFLSKLSIKNTPEIKERKEISNDIQILTKEEKEEIRKRSNTSTHKHDVSVETKNLEGLENFLSGLKTKPSRKDSLTLWEVILSLDFSCLRGEYFWNSGNPTKPASGKCDSQIIKLLQNEKWLLKNDNKSSFYKPSEIMLSELDEEFKNFDTNNSEFKKKFIEQLKFKEKRDLKDNLSSQEEKDRVEELEEKEKKLEFYQNFAKELGFKSTEEALNSIKPKSKDILVENENPFNNYSNLKKEEEYNIDSLKPECNVENAPINIIKINFTKKINNTTSDKKNLTNNINNNEIYQKRINFLSDSEKKDIGYWGEEYVVKCLKKKKLEQYPQGKIIDTENGFNLFLNNSKIVEVIWWNKKSESSRERDIDIIENNNTEYIEVKSTKTDSNTFELSYREWESAKEKGNNYIIYRVFNAKTKMVKLADNIVNPYKLWEDNLLTREVSMYRLKINEE